MSKFAVIKENKVTNIIVCDSKEIAEEVTGLECIESDTAKMHDSWDGIDFTTTHPSTLEEPTEDLAEDPA